MEIEKIGSLLKNMAKICRLKTIGFVATEGSSAGISLLFYPDNENLKKEISAKIVGVIRNISNLKISILKEVFEMTFNSGNNKGRFFSGTGTNPQWGQWIIGIGAPQ